MSSIHVYTCSGYSAGMTSHPAGELRSFAPADVALYHRNPRVGDVSAAEEARLGRIARTQREEAMARRLAEGDRSIPGGRRKSSAVGRIRTQLKGKNNEWNGR